MLVQYRRGRGEHQGLLRSRVERIERPTLVCADNRDRRRFGATLRATGRALDAARIYSQPNIRMCNILRRDISSRRMSTYSVKCDTNRQSCEKHSEQSA